MLMSHKSCIRFTAASAGPIYFALSAVPSFPDTWYYLRIARVGAYLYKNFCVNFFLQDGVTVYRGRELAGASTSEPGAVGLQDPNIFQTYIVCSEYDQAPDDENIWKTRLTYGKVAAGIQNKHS